MPQDSQNNQTKPPERPISPLLDEAQRLLAAGDFEGVIKAAAPQLTSTDLDLVADAYRLVGLASFQLGRNDDAVKYYEEVVKARRNERWSDWFNLCMAATAYKDFVRGKQAFDTMVELGTKAGKESELWQNFYNLVYFYMRSLIDQQQYDAAFEQLVKLGDLYKSLKVTDRTYVIGAVGYFPPSLNDILDAAQPVFEHVGKEKSTAWLKELSDALDEEGKRTVESYMV